MLRLLTLILLPVLIFTAACGPAESTDAEPPKQAATMSQRSALRTQPTPTTAVAAVLIPTRAAAQATLTQVVSPQSGVVIVNTTLLNVRRQAATDSPLIATLALGECVPAIVQEGSWYALILADGRRGWASADYLTAQSTCPPAAPVVAAAAVQTLTRGAKGVVTAAVLNVRAGPGEVFNTVNQIAQNECVDVLAAQDGWLHVTSDTGIDGWSSQQFIAISDDCPAVVQPIAAVNVTTFLTPAASSSDYQGKPFAPDATVIRDAYLFECFGAGDNELRFVTVNTPVQVLGIGTFTAPYPELASGPFIKIRIWDGQYAWITAEAVDAELATLPAISGQCESYDRIEWSAVIQPTPTALIPTPTAYPAWMTAPSQSQSGSCCKVCRKGKACGNSCISASYTCHKGPGCACNG